MRSSFNFNRKGVGADYAKHVSPTVTASGRYTFDYTKLFDEKILPEDQLLIDRLFPQVKLSKLFGAVLRDSRDDVLDPQRGTVLGFDTSVAARALGSEVGFIKSFVQGFWYRRLPGRGFVFATRCAPGCWPSATRGPCRNSVRPANRSLDQMGNRLSIVVKDLPASERFFAGGDTTVRGFALDRLGTQRNAGSSRLSARRQRAHRLQRRDAGAVLEEPAVRLVRRCRQRLPARQRHSTGRAARSPAESACAIDRRSGRCASTGE